jgi:hypothetical protein
VLSTAIVENLKAALEQFRGVNAELSEDIEWQEFCRYF